MRMTPDTEQSIRCTVSSCSCMRFKPARAKHRSCDRCGHGWVVHALEKLQAPPSPSCGPVEVALPGLVLDLSSLVLYGAQAVPVRLKILLDRLYSVLTPEQVGHILHTLGWSLGDYVRGYMLQFPGGTVLDRWVMVTPEEEPLVLRQFLRFGETRPIVELMTRQSPAAVNRPSDPELRPAPKSCQSNICAFPERDGGTAGNIFRNSGNGSHLLTGVCSSGKSRVADCNDTIHHFENFAGGLSLLLPFHFPSSTFQCLAPPTKDLVPPSKLTLQKLSGTQLGRRTQKDGDQLQEKDPISPKSKGEPALKIKTDPDKPNPSRSLWQPNHRIHSDEELDRRWVMDQQENTSSSCPSLSSSFIPMSSSLRSSMSSSYQKLQGSSPSSFHPLPSFSSSFLCPLPASSFSSSLLPLPSLTSSLHSLPSSPCSLPSSPAGGRKGRVCCGVCGKSFYDKGTLKIHYNAVHLKIKHRCTVAGCTMVFSSLRSRNRHSTNPNPRLHTGSSRDTQSDTHTRKTGISNTRRNDDAQTPVHVHNLRNGLNCHTNTHHGNRHNTPPHADSPPPAPHRLTHDGNQNLTQSDSNYRPNPQVPPHPPLPLRAHGASSVGSPTPVPQVLPVAEKTEPCGHPLSLNTAHTAPDHAHVTMANCNGQYGCIALELTNQQRQWASGDSIPKKKPRKSSMPVKIERVKSEGRRNKEEEVY